MPKLSLSQSPKSIANICLFCSDVLPNPSRCRYCGFKYCSEHISYPDHNCIKTRYQKFIDKTNENPNLASGKFKVTCNVCGYVSPKSTPIEFAGEELIQHSQIIGCTNQIFLAEDFKSEHTSSTQNDIDTSIVDKIEMKISDNNFEKLLIVDQIIKISSLHEKRMITEKEYQFIKNQLVGKL